MKEDFFDFILENGIPITGIKNRGLKLNDALYAISLAEKNNISILGGDVYYLYSNRISPAYANWHSEVNKNEKHDIFTMRSCSEAKSYINKLKEPSDSEFLFVLVTKA